MASANAQQPDDRRNELVAFHSTWGPLIEDGLRQAKASLSALETPLDSPANAVPADEGTAASRAAWMLIDRAFQSSASALRALDR